MATEKIFFEDDIILDWKITKSFMQEIDKPNQEATSAGEKDGPKEQFGPNDLVIVLDTSFLVQYSNSTLWSCNVWIKARKEASRQGKELCFFVSDPVRSEFDRLLQERRVDKYGLPLVNQPLEELIGSLQYGEIEVSSDMPFTSAREAWTSHASKRFNPQSSRVRRGPTDADLSVSAATRAIARSGADVWAVSSDMKDVIGPLEDDSQRLLEDGLRVTPIAPFKVEKEYFAGTVFADKTGNLFPVLSREVVADLQVAKLHLGAFTYVIFERDVHSGDASFDVAVGVAEFKNLNGVKIPREYRGGGKQLSLIPVVRLRSLSNGEDTKAMRSYFRRSNGNLPYRLLVVEQKNPLFPVLIFPSGSPRSQRDWFRWQRLLQTTADFLSSQTDSPYARTHY